MGINRRLTYDMLSEARIDPVQKIQALIDQANQAYQQTKETQGETEWPLMDKEGETYGLKGDIILDKRGYIIIPTDGGAYGNYAPQKIRVLTKSGGKVRVIQGDYFEEGWRDAAKILKQIIRDAEIGNGHFREFDPAWEDSQGDKEQMKANKAALRQMNKNIGRKSNAGFEYLESIIRESVNKVINEAFDYWQQSEDNYLMREKLPNGWEKIERSDDEPIYRDPDGNEYVKDDYGHLVMIESVRRRKRMVRENDDDFYNQEDDNGNIGQKGQVKSYNTQAMYDSNVEIDAKENGYDNIADYLKNWWNEVSVDGIPFTWQTLGGGYGFHGTTVFSQKEPDGGTLVCKEIYGQIMFDEYPPERFEYEKDFENRINQGGEVWMR